MTDLFDIATENLIEFPSLLGTPIIAVGFVKSLDKIPEDKKGIWEHLLSKNIIDLVLISNELNVGGLLRQNQEKYGDVLITVGGETGVSHLADLYLQREKSVIPLNFPIKEKRNASFELWNRVCESPDKYIRFSKNIPVLSNFLKINFQQNVDNIKENIISLLELLQRPYIFYNRVQDITDKNFIEVDEFFKCVVNKVFQNTCFETYELGKNATNEPLMDVELYKSINRSSLVFSDITSVRPNNMLELGYAIGLGKKILITAKEGTKLPWDTDKIHTYKWSPKKSNKKLIEELTNYIVTNINKKLIKEI
jgi:hypothetical protein